MFKTDVQEAIPILDTVLKAMLAQSPASGVIGANLRATANALRANAEVVLMADAAGPPLENVFRLAQANGITLPQMDYVRNIAVAQPATLPGAILIRDSLIQYALATEGLIIAGMTFVSRDAVEAARQLIYAGFAPMEETVADSIDPIGYQTLIAQHAAINHHLTLTAQPLPKMLGFIFAEPLPTLTAAYKLYADASRADELRGENHVIHPAFMPPTGRALSR
jgi:hypothetical protein